MRKVLAALAGPLVAVVCLLGSLHPLAAQADGLAAARRFSDAAVALDAEEQQTLAQLMLARVAAGESIPSLDPTLVAIARRRSADMAARGYFSHYTPEGSTVFDLLDSFDVPWRFGGETLALNNFNADKAAAAAAQRLLQSPEHHAIILDPRYNAVGIGEATSSRGLHYFTVVFINR